MMLLVVAWWAPSAVAQLKATDEKELVKMADGFDFPVGPPDAVGYYKARGYRPNGHQGEDWNGKGGGNTDLGDPIYSIGHGIVVLARDVRSGWGNVVIVRHVFQDNDGKVKVIDSLYGHLHSVTVREGQTVRKGDLVGTMGNNRGMYYTHLHFEIRKNLRIGMRRSSFKRDFSNYYDPTDFIKARRTLRTPRSKYKVATQTYDDSRKYFPPSRGVVTSPGDTSVEPEEKKTGGLFQRSKDDYYW